MFIPSKLLLSLSLALSALAATFPAKVIYQSPTGLFLENIAVRPSSQLLLTSVLTPTLYTFDPSAENGTLDEVYTFPNATALTGIVEYKPDVYALVASTLDLNTISATPGSVAIYSVDFTGSGAPAVRQAARIPESTMTNGLSTLPGHPDVVLAADSDAGLIWEVNVRTGNVSVKFQDDALSPGAPPPALGANGVHVNKNFLYFTNSQKGTVSRVSLSGGPVELLGTAVQAGGTPDKGYDDFTFDEQGRPLVAMSAGAVQLFEQARNGTWVQTTIAGSVQGGDSDGLVGATSVAFGREEGKCSKILYVTGSAGQIAAVDTTGL
ncbi:hypothetical protein R3P38DRAFT_2882552 [Favolaschia claudopus]|uniref:SMP-30/Gluconolactonase/LRE-like region domain-containing protein n=1 Tax=Favolaschia claudopus TaxID=2862362 RepID=A0AAW0D1H2_9AGAR